MQAWYQGGLSVIDFTDSSNPREIGYFDRGPIHDEHLILGGYWSTYWYDGKIYGTEIARGLDVLSLVPSEHLTENEIAAAALADQGELFNPQQQFKVTWPAEPVVALAYIDQLDRTSALSAGEKNDLADALDRSAAQLASGDRNRGLSRELQSLARNLGRGAGTDMDSKRRAGLAETLNGIAARLR